MISDTFSTLSMVEKFKSLCATSTAVFLYTSLTEIVGMLILLMFLSTIFALQAVPTFLPLILAISGAAGGYRLGSSEAMVTWRKTALVVSAILLTISGCAAVAFLWAWESLLAPARCLAWGLGTLAATFFGSWIAREYIRLLRKKA